MNRWDEIGLERNQTYWQKPGRQSIDLLQMNIDCNWTKVLFTIESIFVFNIFFFI